MPEGHGLHDRAGTEHGGGTLRGTGEVTAPNADQIRDWDGEQGLHWVTEADRYDTMNAPFGEALLKAVALRPGERVLDVGCGNGATSIAAAGRVRPGGTVKGLDLSGPMLDLARRRATAAGADEAEFVQADAQTHGFPESGFDACISRFGLMFFEGPETAFANLARAVRPGGRIVFTVWQGLERSEWIFVPGAAAAAHVGLPEGLDGPGPFALADPARIRGILDGAGFVDVAIEDLTRPVYIGADVDEAMGFISSMPLVRDLLARAPEEKAAAAVEAAREALVPYAGPQGVVLSAGAWLVSARR